MAETNISSKTLLWLCLRAMLMKCNIANGITYPYKKKKHTKQIERCLLDVDWRASVLSIGRQTPPTNVDAIDHGTWFPLGPYCRAIWVFVHCASRDKMLHRHWHKSTSLQQQQQCGFDSASTGRIKDRIISVHCKHAKEKKKTKKHHNIHTYINHKYYIYIYMYMYLYIFITMIQTLSGDFFCPPSFSWHGTTGASSAFSGHAFVWSTRTSWTTPPGEPWWESLMYSSCSWSLSAISVNIEANFWMACCPHSTFSFVIKQSSASLETESLFSKRRDNALL